MLVLTRKEGESVFIGNDIELKIISISRDRVKIGIEAPKDISLIRGELRDAVIKANIEANIGDKDIKELKNLHLKK